MIIQISTNNCTYSAATRRFVTEASEISMNCIAAVIKMESEKTGVVKEFLYRGLVRDNREMETIAFVYASRDGLGLHVLND